METVAVSRIIPKFHEPPITGKIETAENRRILTAYMRTHQVPFQLDRKYDGEREVCWINGGDVTFANKRSFRSRAGELPNLERAVRLAVDRNVESAVLDGELIPDVDSRFYDENGFLNNRVNRDGMTFVVFDLLEVNGTQYYQSPLRKRLETLDGILKPNEKVQRPESHLANTQEEIVAAYNEAVAQGREGLIAKPMNSPYMNGYWMKLKWQEELLVVAMGIRKTKGFLQNHVAESFVVGFYRPERGEFEAFSHAASGLSLEQKAALSAHLQTKPFIDEDKENCYSWPATYVTLRIATNGTLSTGFRHPKLLEICPDVDPKEAIEH